MLATESLQQHRNSQAHSVFIRPGKHHANRDQIGKQDHFTASATALNLLTRFLQLLLHWGQSIIQKQSNKEENNLDQPGQYAVYWQSSTCACILHLCKYNQAQHTTTPFSQRSTAGHSTAQHSTAQHSTAQHSTAQHSTAQHSTAQHSTAQHSTAQHSTAQHSTAQHILSLPGGSGAPGSARSTCFCSIAFTLRKASSRAAVRTLSNLSFHTPACRPRLSLPALMARKESQRRRQRKVISRPTCLTSCKCASTCSGMPMPYRGPTLCGG